MIPMKKTVSIVWIVVMLSVSVAVAGGDFHALTGPYLGQSPPRHEAALLLDTVAFVFSTHASATLTYDNWPDVAGPFFLDKSLPV